MKPMRRGSSKTAKSRRRPSPALRSVSGRSRLRHSDSQSTLLIESMLEHLPHMVFLKDAEGLRFVHFNQAAEELLGYSRFELLGKNDYDLFPKEEADFFTAKDREVLRSGRLLDIPEEPIQTRAKGMRILHTKKIPICDASGRPRYLLGISEDITDRKEVEKELRAAKEELERRVIARTAELIDSNHALQREMADHQTLAASMRDLGGRLIHAQEEERARVARDLHDHFSQQLALIGIELEELGQFLPGAPGSLHSLQRDLRERVRQLSGDLHGLSHDLHPSKLDHLGLLAAVQSLCRQTSQRHNLAVHCVGREIPSSLPRPVGLCLYRIAQEALRNVVKHSHAREVRVEITGMTGWIRLAVRDSGIGFTFDRAGTRPGLGLVSMRERIHAIGGRIAIRSQPSHGTEIEVRAPIGAATR